MDSQEEHSAARHLVSFPHISNAKNKVRFSFLQQQQQQASTSRQYLMQTVVSYIIALEPQLA